MTNLTTLDLDDNLLSGSIPPELANSSTLRSLVLSNNQLSGSIPPGFGNLSNLESLNLSNNQLIGTIPPEIGNLNILQNLVLSNNQLSGSIPPELSNMSTLLGLYLAGNQLTGSIPPLNNFQILHLENNRLSGTIPPEIGGYGNISFREIYLNGNRLTGGIPTEFSNLKYLRHLHLDGNKLQGRIPPGLVNLLELSPAWGGSTDIGYNALFTGDPALIDFLSEIDPGWEQTQTLAPENINAAVVDSRTVRISWTPIIYTGDTGGYRVYYSTHVKGPYAFAGQTGTKFDTSLQVTGLNPGTLYYFRVITRTDPHAYNLDTVDSRHGEILSATTRGDIQVNAPTAGDIFYKGRQISIAWTTEGVTGDIKILLIRSDKSGGYLVASDIPYNSSPYDYTIPPEVSPGSYFVRVKNDNAAPGDSGVFTISTASITVTTPSGGETYSTGDSIPIAWTTAGITGNVKIGLVRSDRSGGYLVTPGTPYDNSPFAYTIPAGVSPGTYFIVVKKAGVTKGKSGDITIN